MKLSRTESNAHFSFIGTANTGETIVAIDDTTLQNLDPSFGPPAGWSSVLLGYSEGNGEQKLVDMTRNYPEGNVTGVLITNTNIHTYYINSITVNIIPGGGSVPEPHSLVIENSNYTNNKFLIKSNYTTSTNILASTPSIFPNYGGVMTTAIQTVAAYDSKIYYLTNDTSAGSVFTDKATSVVEVAASTTTVDLIPTDVNVINVKAHMISTDATRIVQAGQYDRAGVKVPCFIMWHKGTGNAWANEAMVVDVNVLTLTAGIDDLHSLEYYASSELDTLVALLRYTDDVSNATVWESKIVTVKFNGSSYDTYAQDYTPSAGEQLGVGYGVSAKPISPDGQYLLAPTSGMYITPTMLMAWDSNLSTWSTSGSFKIEATNTLDIEQTKAMNTVTSLSVTQSNYEVLQSPDSNVASNLKTATMRFGITPGGDVSIHTDTLKQSMLGLDLLMVNDDNLIVTRSSSTNQCDVYVKTTEGSWVRSTLAPIDSNTGHRTACALDYISGNYIVGTVSPRTGGGMEVNHLGILQSTLPIIASGRPTRPA